jgi:hypothetical protein
MKLEHQHQQHEVGNHHHQQHEVGTSIINNMKLEHQHHQSTT